MSFTRDVSFLRGLFYAAPYNIQYSLYRAGAGEHLTTNSMRAELLRLRRAYIQTNDIP